jgi:hypothetical protein
MLQECSVKEANSLQLHILWVIINIDKLHPFNNFSSVGLLVFKISLMRIQMISTDTF